MFFVCGRKCIRPYEADPLIKFKLNVAASHTGCQIVHFAALHRHMQADHACMFFNMHAAFLTMYASILLALVPSTLFADQTRGTRQADLPPECHCQVGRGVLLPPVWCGTSRTALSKSTCALNVRIAQPLHSTGPSAHNMQPAVQRHCPQSWKKSSAELGECCPLDTAT